MGRLTTHILDTARGCPGAGVAIELFRLDGEAGRLGQFTTNSDGRCDRPLLEGDQFRAGRYELVFHVGEYFRRQKIALPDPPFLDQVVIRFGISESEQHYHVPLLISPYGYSTYRGS